MPRELVFGRNLGLIRAIFVESVYGAECLVQGLVPSVDQARSLNDDEAFYQLLKSLYACALSVKDHAVGRRA